MSAFTSYEIVAPQMRSLQQLDASLQRLDIRWEVIDTTARIVCPEDAADFLQTLDKTRHAFGTLASELVEHMAATHLGNRLEDLGARAQIAIDILVRNLFERTADVGFIATDAPLVQFVQSHVSQAGKCVDPASVDALRHRLLEYRAKYTVYDDIVLLDTQARPLLDLAGRYPAAPSASHTFSPPPWWPSMLQKDGYVESYAPVGWFPDGAPHLLYAHRVMGSNKQPCGAVVLRFGLLSELQSVFADLLQHADDKVIIALVDQHNQILASSQNNILRPGDIWAHQDATETTPDDRRTSMVQHQGHDYLVAHRSTRGYQGYRGLPWRGIALIRLDHAFRTNKVPADPNMPFTAAHGGKDGLLNAVVARARAIEDDLTQVIWNGKMTESALANGASINAVFDQISRTSKDTIALFDRAIADLRLLMMAGRTTELQAHARLAVTIMDRNLYERANDCRWWALSHQLATVLADWNAQPTGQQAVITQKNASSVLRHLNSLYTVYRRVALFDNQGRILAVSRDAETLPETALHLDPELLRRTMGLKGSQAYAASPMQPQALADGDAAYLYCAAIRMSPNSPILGGIALVFDCANELKAMLKDALPAAGDTLAFFTDVQGRILATTADHARVGDFLDAVPSIAHAQNPSSGTDNPAQPVRWKGQDFVAVTACSSGYREFKRTDEYRETILSVLLMPVQTTKGDTTQSAMPTSTARPGFATQRYGVVQCGALLLAIQAQHVQKAVSAQSLLRVPGAGQLAGLIQVVQSGKNVMVPAYDTHLLIGQTPLKDPKTAIAVVVTSHQRTLALLVDKLLSVVSFEASYPIPPSIAAAAPWITGILGDNAGKTMVYALDPNGFDAKQLPLPAHILDTPAPATTGAVSAIESSVSLG